MRKPATLALAAAACAVFAGAVQAQSGKLGAFQGTVVITGVEAGAHTSVNFGATVKIGLPVTDAGKSSARAEADDVDKASAMATITQWDTKGKNASPDSDGKITNEMGFIDPARLMAKTRLVRSGQATGSFVDMASDLRLAR